MRRWRAIVIAGGILVVAAVLALSFVKPNRVSAKVLSKTNGYRRVLINNPTAQPCYVTAWGEFYRNEAWERLGFSNVLRNIVEPGTSMEGGVLMPTNTPKRIVFVYSPIKKNGLGAWVNKLKAQLRLKPQVELEYIQVE